jgi:hypothetical protein
MDRTAYFPSHVARLSIKYYVVSTVHCKMRTYNDQRNEQLLNVFIYLLLPYMFRAFV